MWGRSEKTGGSLWACEGHGVGLQSMGEAGKTLKTVLEQKGVPEPTALTEEKPAVIQGSCLALCLKVKVAQSCLTLCHPTDCSKGAHQAPLSMEFSRQEFWSDQPFPSPGELPDPRIKPRSPALQAHSLPSEPPGITSLSTEGQRTYLLASLCNQIMEDVIPCQDSY